MRSGSACTGTAVGLAGQHFDTPGTCRRDERLGMRQALLMNEARRPSLDGSLASTRHHHRRQAF